MRRFTAADAQQALGFMLAQTTYIESQVVEIQYPEVQYPQLIPVDTSAPEWTKSITYFSMDRTGKAGWFHAYAKDIHVADVERAKHEETVEMADIGYRYNIEEIGTAMMTPGVNLPVERAAAARRAYEEFVDNLALRGDSTKNKQGLINHSGVTIVNAAEVSGGNTDWDDKTAEEILQDVNDALIGVYTGTLTVEIADTILMPITALALIATKRVPDTTMTVLQFLLQNNVYTFQTGRPLTIRGVRGLETAGVGGVGRMVVYRRAPDVLKLHIPMPHRFLPVWQTGPLVFDVPGIFRLSGLEIRKPAAVRYIDGITGDNPS